MKKILLAAGIATMFAACDTKSKTNIETNKNVVGVDTEVMHNNTVLTDTAAIVKKDTVYIEKPVEKPVEKKTAKAIKPVTKHTNATGTEADKPKEATSDKSAIDKSAQPTTTTQPAPAEEEKKKGWSNAAKGAAIGGVGGAVAGAVVSKKKGVGAIVGGVVGAGVGYAIGRGKDKKAKAADTTKTK